MSDGSTARKQRGGGRGAMWKNLKMVRAGGNTEGEEVDVGKIGGLAKKRRK